MSDNVNARLRLAMMPILLLAVLATACFCASVHPASLSFSESNFTNAANTTTIPANNFGVIAPYGLSITLINGTTLLGGNATLRTSWSGSSSQYTMYVYSGQSASCSQNADNLVSNHTYTSASVHYITIHPTASAYYCYKIVDSAGNYAYSQVVHAYVADRTTTATTTTPSTTTVHTTTVENSTASNSSITASHTTIPSNATTTTVLPNPAMTINSIRIKCIGCTSAVNSTEGITTISMNAASSANLIRSLITSMNISAAPSFANALSVNSMLLNSFVSNSTPEGFSVTNDSTVTSHRNATETGNSVTVEWSSSGVVGSHNISIDAIRNANANLLSSLPPSQLGVQYVLNYLPNTSNVSVTSHTEVHASATVLGNNSTTQYVPSNVTVYSSRENAAVISVTNLVENRDHHVSTTGISRMPLSAMVIVPKGNMTALAAGIRFYNSITESHAVANSATSRTNDGNVIGVIAVNSSANDSLISSVQYKFNVSRSLLSVKNVVPQEIHLYRRNAAASKWVVLPTNLTGSNATQYFYTATSPGMSVYAIGFGYLETNITTTNSTVPSVPAPQKTILDPLVMLAVLLLVVAAAITYFVLSKKGSSEPPSEPAI